jgi:hypothetical protein
MRRKNREEMLCRLVLGLNSVAAVQARTAIRPALQQLHIVAQLSTRPRGPSAIAPFVLLPEICGPLAPIAP